MISFILSLIFSVRSINTLGGLRKREREYGVHRELLARVSRRTTPCAIHDDGITLTTFDELEDELIHNTSVWVTDEQGHVSHTNIPHREDTHDEKHRKISILHGRVARLLCPIYYYEYTYTHNVRAT